LTAAAQVLRITDTVEAPGTHLVEATLTSAGREVQGGSTRIVSTFGRRDAADIRWYLEEFPRAPFDPAPDVARRVDERLATLGTELFAALREAIGDSAGHLNVDPASLRVEVESAGPAMLPWELLLDGATGLVLAVYATAFVRRSSRSRPALSPRPSDRVRVLLVISRPGRERDIPFQSVARPLLRALEGDPTFEIDVLRPATYDALLVALDLAAAAGRPYTVVHFDGHGAVEAGKGYLVFEGRNEAADWISGSMFGRALVQNGTALAVLNACRSAHADYEEREGPHPIGVRSLAEEAVETGVSGVVGMQYDLFVGTASRLVAAIYTAIANGSSLGEAVTAGRRRLYEHPGELGVADWIVPVVYEQEVLAPIRSSARSARAEHSTEDGEFVGRDSVLLAADRAFDVAPIVLLHGMAGAGKTHAAREFAEWYERTGGAEATEFSAYENGPRQVLPQTRDPRTAADLLVIDAIDVVTTLPHETQKAVIDQLRASAESGRRILLTSRDQSPWLDDLAVRIAVEPMPLEESVVLLRTLLGERTPVDLDAWRPALDFAQGNPAALRTVVEMAQSDGAANRSELEKIVFSLNQGTYPGSDREISGSVRAGPASLLSERDWRVLSAVTHHRGYADAVLISRLADPSLLDRVTELEGLSGEDFEAAFWRASAAGLMTHAANTYFRLHPLLALAVAEALPSRLNLGRTQALARAFFSLASAIGRSAFREFESGAQREQSLKWMRSEEANLLHAWRLGLEHGWRDDLHLPLFGLVRLYEHEGRRREWAALVDRTETAVTDGTGNPLPNCSDAWFNVMLWRLKMAQQDLELDRAKSLAHELLRRSTDGDDSASARYALTRLADIERLQDDVSCVRHYNEALDTFDDANDRQERALVHFNLGLAYQQIPEIRDLNQALQHYTTSFELHDERDNLGRARCMSQLAQVALLAADDMSDNDGPPEAITRNRKVAFDASVKALQALPPSAHGDRGVILTRLGGLHRVAGQYEQATSIDTGALQAYSDAGDAHGAAIARFNLALDLAAQRDRSEDALVYANAAEAAFAQFGPASAKERDAALRLRDNLKGRVAG
jgi:tetratricopeptide (TPR) repeat protein